LLAFVARNVPGAAFNVVTESVSFVFRDDEGLVVQATIPAGAGGWTANGKRITYSDPTGSQDGIVSVVLKATPSFDTSFQARVRIRSSVATAAGTRTGTAVLRVGNDCWSDTTPCSGHGSSVKCRGRVQP
jgi:hypothetical protein